MASTIFSDRGFNKRAILSFELYKYAMPPVWVQQEATGVKKQTCIQLYWYNSFDFFALKQKKCFIHRSWKVLVMY